MGLKHPALTIGRLIAGLIKNFQFIVGKGLIKSYELKRDEIYSLATRKIIAEILEEKRKTIGKNSIFRLRIKSRIQASDFVKAEIEDSKQEKKEAKVSDKEEMEQHISAEIDPVREIAKAYLHPLYFA